MNPLLQSYSQPTITQELVQYFVSQDKFKTQLNQHGWTNNYLMPAHDIAPTASHHLNQFEHLSIGTDGRKSINYSHEHLLPLLFPWLYPLGKGHWSFTTGHNSLTDLTSSSDEDNDELDDVHEPTHTRNKKLTIKQYAKFTLTSADRRWARDPLYLFFICDTLEKINIHNYARHVVTPRHVAEINAGNLYMQDPSTGERYIREDKVSTIPHTIRSSYRYKRRAFLDIMARFREFGEPQLFMTFSCDDFAPDMLNAVNSAKPWDDPVLFALHFQRKWFRFFNVYIKKHFSKKIGGIKHWAWVMEVQSRGSPHIHTLFWTNKSALDLLGLNFISASLPPPEDPLRALVAKHQIHNHSNYCLRHTNNCRFGFPFAPCPSPNFENGRFSYHRTAESSMINPYSPYLLNIAKVQNNNNSLFTIATT